MALGLHEAVIEGEQCIGPRSGGLMLAWSQPPHTLTHLSQLAAGVGPDLFRRFGSVRFNLISPAS